MNERGYDKTSHCGGCWAMACWASAKRSPVRWLCLINFSAQLIAHFFSFSSNFLLRKDDTQSLKHASTTRLYIRNESCNCNSSIWRINSARSFGGRLCTASIALFFRSDARGGKTNPRNNKRVRLRPSLIATNQSIRGPASVPRQKGNRFPSHSSDVLLEFNFSLA